MIKVFKERQVITARAKRPPPLTIRLILLNYSKLMIYFLLFLETCQEAQIFLYICKTTNIVFAGIQDESYFKLGNQKL